MPETILYQTIKKKSDDTSFGRFNVEKSIKAPFTGSSLSFGQVAVLDEQGAESSTRPAVLKESAFNWGTDREWQGLTQAYSAVDSVPEPLALVQLASGKPALLSEWVTGRELHETNDIDTRLAVGEWVARLHAATPIDGAEWQKSSKGDGSYYDALIGKWLAGSLPTLSDHQQSVEMVSTLFKGQSDWGEIQPVFTHQDLHEGQVLVRDTHDFTVLDFELWQESDPLDDLAVNIFHLVRQDQPTENWLPVIAGYQHVRGEALSELERHRIAFLSLFMAVRAVGLFTRWRPHFISASLDTLEKVTAFWDQETLWKLR